MATILDPNQGDPNFRQPNMLMPRAVRGNQNPLQPQQGQQGQQQGQGQFMGVPPQQALLTLGSNLLAASQPSLKPQGGFAGRLGQALQGTMPQLQQMAQQRFKRNILESEMDLQKRQTELEEYQQKLSERQREEVSKRAGRMADKYEKQSREDNILSPKERAGLEMLRGAEATGKYDDLQGALRYVSPKAPSLVRELEAAGVDPQSPQGREAIVGSRGTNVTVNTGGAFGTQSGKGLAERQKKIVNTGQQAVGTEQNLIQMADLVGSGDVQTGAMQPLLTGLQGIAADFGVDLDAAADKAGIDALGDLDKKEEFDRLAKQVIIDGFEKFKGNLNRREVQLAQDAFANLGRSEGANIRAIAAGLASSQVARERAMSANNATTAAEMRDVTNQLLSNDTERFEELRQQYHQQLERRFQESSTPTPNQAAPPQETPTNVIDFNQLPD